MGLGNAVVYLVVVALGLLVGCGPWWTVKHVPLPQDQLESLAFHLTSTNSPFAEYDYAVVKSVQQQWWKLIEKNELTDVPRVKYPVIYVSFKLDSDGNLHELSVKSPHANNRWGELCVSAIRDVSPFQPFPETLRILCSNEMRQINFTFFY